MTNGARRTSITNFPPLSNIETKMMLPMNPIPESAQIIQNNIKPITRVQGEMRNHLDRFNRDEEIDVKLAELQGALNLLEPAANRPGEVGEQLQ